MSELNLNLFLLEMVVSVRLLLLRDMILVTFRSHIFQLKVLRLLLYPSVPVMVKLPLIFGTLLVRRNLENLENVTILKLIVLLLCLISPQEILIEMLINGTKTLPKYVQMYQSV
jgi:hypothetical protein